MARRATKPKRDGESLAAERLRREREINRELGAEDLPPAEYPAGSCGWWDPDESGGGA